MLRTTDTTSYNHGMLRILVLVTIFTLILGDANPSLEVTIKQGKLRGHRLTSRKGRDIFAFQRIPYAKPPVGDLRFRAAQPPDQWDGVLDATHTAPECIQKDIFRFREISGQEDCLYLNVYTPQISGSLDVMVYIHGGGWISGTGSYAGPQYLLDHDVILVTLSYRLGALGFLSTGDEVCPGNNGLKDQRAALRWVKNNIAAFGGNPDKVTIFGESAGGASVHYQVISPASRGLFHRAISLSGTALGQWAIAPNGSTVHNTIKVATLLNCPTQPNSELISCLRSKDAVDIINTDKAFMIWDNNPVIPFKPVLETNVSKGDKVFVSAHPIEMLKTANPVSWMTGVTSSDGAWEVSRLFGLNLVEEMDKNWDFVAPLTMMYHDLPAAVQKDINKRVRKYYFGDRPISRDTRQEVVDMFTDFYFLSGAINSVKLHSETAETPAFLYYFDYRGAYSYSSTLGDPDTDYGVCHADELLYLLYDDKAFPSQYRTESDERMIDILTSLWTNFAITGNPTGEWPRVSSTESPEYGHIKFDGVHIENGLLSERAKFWSTIPLSNKVPAKKKEEL